MTDKEVLIPNRSQTTLDKVQYTAVGQGVELSNISSTAPDNEAQNRSMAGEPTRKNVYMLLGVAVVAIAVIVLAAVFIVYSGSSLTGSRARRSLSKFNFDDIFGYKFYASRYSVEWISDTEYLYDKYGDIYLIDLAGSGKSVLYLSKYTMKPINGTKHWISPTHRYFLIASNVKTLYRYSFYADYYIHDIKSNTSTKLNPPGEKQIRYASWNAKDNAIVYVYENNIYWRSSAVDPNTESQITTTGKEHLIFNGIPDWVYEEEVFNTDHTLWFSEDGKYLCYATFDETNVPYFRYPIYSDPSDSYGRIDKIAYPKAGKGNPTATVNVIYLKDLKKGEERTASPLNVPAELSTGEYYVTQVAWVDNNRVSVQWLNREQTESVVVRYMANNGQEEHKFVEDVNGGWVYEKYPAGHYPKNEDYFITLLPMLQNEKSGKFIHLVKVPLTARGPSEAISITAGEWEVTEFWYNEKQKQVFFISTEISPTQRHLYSVNLDGSNKECLTCQTAEYGSGRCTYFSADFSTERTHFVLSCSGPGVPQTTMHIANSNNVASLVNNSGLQSVIASTSMPEIVQFTIPIQDEHGETYDLYAKETRPPGFDKQKNYAVLFNVYGGPGSQMVVETFGMSFTAYLVSNFDIIVVEVDARGSGFRGEKFKQAVYRNLGEYEAADTIAAGKYMQQRNYVDPSKLAIWGWSYGGYLTSYILGTGTDVFKCGVAVAPVADWHYYDSIYTERYMGLPTKEDNLAGYKKSSVLPYCKNFRNDSYLLVHGTGDDNVHFQNAAQLVRELVEAHVSFRVQFYTDKTHGLFGGATRRHLYWLISTFLQDCLAI